MTYQGDFTCLDETFREISLSRNLWKKSVWMKCRLHMFQPVITF